MKSVFFFLAALSTAAAIGSHSFLANGVSVTTVGVLDTDLDLERDDSVDATESRTLLQKVVSRLTSDLDTEEEEVKGLGTQLLRADLRVSQGPGQHPMWKIEQSFLGNQRIWTCSATLFLAGILCSAGGIGGGGIYVTVLMMVGDISTEDAVPLSKAIVFLGSLASMSLNLRRIFSSGDVLVDYDIVRVVVPASLMGTYGGVVLNWVIPNWFIVMLLCITLLSMSIMVTRTTVQQFIEEQNQQANEFVEDASEALGQAATPANVPTPANSEGSGPAGEEAEEKSQDGGEGERVEGASASCDDPFVEAPKTMAEKQIPEQPQLAAPPDFLPQVSKSRRELTRTDILVGVAMLLCVVLCGAFRLHAAACQAAYPQDVQKVCYHPVIILLGGRMEQWMRIGTHGGAILTSATVAPIAACLIALGTSGHRLVEQQLWRWSDVCLYSSVAVLTGCLAGLVGIGGGLIFSPFFLFMGVDPGVAVATSSTCVIFTSSSTTMQYLLTDRIIVSLCLVYGLVNLVASYSGTSLVHCLQDNFKARRSLISGIVGVGVIISTVLALTKLRSEMQGLKSSGTALLGAAH